MPRLTTKHVAAAFSPGRCGDGLYLRVADGGSKQWLFRYIRDKRERQMGLGPVGGPPAGITLAMARGLAAQARGVLREGRDSLDERGRARTKSARALARTFQATAGAMLDAKAGEWSNAKHRAQWRATLATYAFPIIGALPAATVDTEAALSVLRPIWTAKHETASRLRGRTERVLAYAKTLGLRAGENPATWRGPHNSPHFYFPISCVGSRRLPTRPKNFLDDLASCKKSYLNHAMADV